MIQINASELQSILESTPADQNIMLVGRHGIGKSRIISDYFQRHALSVVAFFLGQMSDPGDLIGLMYRDEETHRSRFMPPYWWPSDDTPIVLFLDELNRARPEILQAVMDLTLNKRLAGRSLPPGSIIVSAVNSGDEYQITDLDPALISRFNIYEFKPSVEEWLIWANDAQLDQRVISFIQAHNHYLDSDENSDQMSTPGDALEKNPDRRAWERVAQYISNLDRVESVHIKAIAGIVGTTAALQLQKSLREVLAITVEELLFDFNRRKGRMKKFTLQDYILLNEQVVYYLNGGHYPKKKKAAILKNLYAYIQHLQKAKFNEGVAHFASMLVNPRFEKVSGFVLIESADLMEALAEYIQNIDV